MSDIVKRLRDPVNNWNTGGRFEAADTIEALQARLDRLEKALRRIADNPYKYGMRIQRFKSIARTALNDTDGETG